MSALTASHPRTGEAVNAGATASTLREDAIAAAIGAWAVIGLMLDGRAHETGAVESFFTAWHAVLYSGVGAAFAAVAVMVARHRRGPSARSPALPTGYGLALVGIAVMALAGAADMAWHQAFGIEEDLAALLSPTHLLLLVGGLLLLTAPVRSAWRRTVAGVGWRALGPAVVATMLTATTVGFFLEFASPFHDAGVFAGGGDHGGAELGIAGVVITTVLLVGALALLVGRFGRLPFGAATLSFTGTVALLSLAADFSVGGAVVAAAVGGLTADLLLRRADRPAPQNLPVLLAVVPVPLWLTFYAIVAGFLELDWDPELWTGSVVLASLAAYAVGLLATTGAARARIS